MIGLEYVLSLSNVTHTQLAEHLNIRKQNINLWIKKKQGIPKKYLPVISQFLNVNEDYISKDLTDEDKIHLQIIKLKFDLDHFDGAEDLFNGEEEILAAVLGHNNKSAQSTIEKELIEASFSSTLDAIDDGSLESVKIMIELMEYLNDTSLRRVINIVGQLFEIVEDDGAYDGDEINQSLFDLLL